MVKRIAVFLLLFILTASFVSGQSNESVYIIPIKGEINYATEKYVQNSINEAEESGADMIIFEIDTLGGAVQSAVKISKAIVDAKADTVSYILDDAISAGVIISISSDKVVASPSINIGSAETIPKTEKNISYWTGELRSVAKQKGRNDDIIAGMADVDIEIEGIKEKGKLLNLTSDEALKHDIVDKVVSSKDELFKYLDIEGSNVTELKYDWKTNIARFTNNITISSILIAIGIIGIVGEIFIAGFGALGTIGILSFALFFAGRMFAGHAGVGVLVLFITGIILMIVEVVIPGFGLPGIAGIASIVVSIILSFANPMNGAVSLGIGIVLSIAALILIFKFAPKSKYFDHIILKKSQSDEDGYLSNNSLEELKGKSGTVLTFMRPAGTILVAGNRYDAISEGAFIDKGTEIEIVNVEGSKLVVRKK